MECLQRGWERAAPKGFKKGQLTNRSCVSHEKDETTRAWQKTKQNKIDFFVTHKGEYICLLHL